MTESCAITRTKQTLASILRRRGFDVPDPMPYDDFSVNNATGELLMVFITDAAVGIGPIRTLLQKIKDAQCTRAIFISPSLTTCAKTQIVALRDEGVMVSHFTPIMLQTDIVEHYSVPPHRLLTSDERVAFLTERHLTLTQLPKIKISDPICRYYGGRRDDVFEITRNCPNVGFFKYYRCVVDSGEP